MARKTRDKHISDFAAQGGKARAHSLTAEERSEIARYAVEARWRKEGRLVEVPRVSCQGELPVGNAIVPCAVLEDGTRLLNQGGFLKAIGRSRTPKAGSGATVAERPAFLSAKNLSPFYDAELVASTTPIRYRDSGGRIAYGYRAELLPRVCEVFLSAREAGALTHGQVHIARECEIILRGLARVGIIALVDEATGYQDMRAKDALAKILEQFIAKELRQWVKTFPDDFYKELFRLRKLAYPPNNGLKPQYIGKLTNDLVYARLAPGVLEELKRMTPRDEKGRAKHRYHQQLTEEIGHPRLREHLGGVVVAMKLSKTWAEFVDKLDRVYPKFGHSFNLALDDPEQR
jgi:hypothetical protein